MFSEKFLNQASSIISNIDLNIIENMAIELDVIRARNGRIFFIGSGGGAGHSSHAVNDFRKIANIECYTPTDNVSELTARINDEGWDTSYVNYLKVSNFNKNDAVFVFSVGGGNIKKNISNNLVQCVKYSDKIGGSVLGVVGRDGGFTKKIGKQTVLLIPVIDDNLITPHTESFQAVIWHLLVSHPTVAKNITKWESTK
jgi:D-sedoheptulose 7-phosphate isomerase